MREWTPTNYAGPAEAATDIGAEEEQMYRESCRDWTLFLAVTLVAVIAGAVVVLT